MPRTAAMPRDGAEMRELGPDHPVPHSVAAVRKGGPRREPR
ncbi:hypothetical protein ACIPIU_00590 [Streptomyces massasporeus]